MPTGSSNSSRPIQPAIFHYSGRHHYSGVDKLLIASMLEESNSLNISPSSRMHFDYRLRTPSAERHPPSGRGLGYPGAYNETRTQIPSPSNRSELELYQLLERANLLNYFGTFLNFGGDDVQQLSDADEEEFLEIMSLVGMTQKPLHVRRLQKSLIEWRETKDLELSYTRQNSYSQSKSISSSTTPNRSYQPVSSMRQTGEYEADEEEDKLIEVMDSSRSDPSSEPEGEQDPTNKTQIPSEPQCSSDGPQKTGDHQSSEGHANQNEAGQKLQEEPQHQSEQEPSTSS